MMYNSQFSKAKKKKSSNTSLLYSFSILSSFAFFIILYNKKIKKTLLRVLRQANWDLLSHLHIIALLLVLTLMTGFVVQGHI